MTTVVERHKCFVQANKALENDNTMIDFAYTLDTGDVRPIVRTAKIDDAKRGKPKTLMASHCPFCGRPLAPQANTGTKS